EQCKEEVFQQMKPELLFSAITRTYLGKIRNHVENSLAESSTTEGEPERKLRKIKIDLSSPIPLEQAATVFKKIQQFTKGGLAKDFGDVPEEHYLEQNEEGLFRLRESSSVIDQKFGAALKERGL